MSVSRDDFSIAFRSALLQRGGAQKFSVLSLIFLALLIFFLDVYGTKFTKPVRGFINDVVYRVTFIASTPTRFLPQAGKDLTNYLNVKKENEALLETIYDEVWEEYRVANCLSDDQLYALEQSSETGTLPEIELETNRRFEELINI